ncbi:MAG: M16 family metallopeptidase, partial [Oscillospiraceae bacterium]
DYEAVGYLLTDSCEKYPDYRLLSQRFAELYDANINFNSGLYGDLRGSCFVINYIDDRYALEGEKLEQEACALLLDCLLSPKTVNGVFDADVTRIVSSEIVDAISAKINDKRWYASQRSALTAYVGEPQSRPIEGTLEQARAITPESAWRAYRNMLERGHIEIIAAGCSDFSECERMFAEAFAKIDRQDVYPLKAPKPSPLKPEAVSVTDAIPMQQAILRIYFKLPEQTDRFAFALMNLVLGGMTMSRFFRNIREKQSLCYYCSSGMARLKKTFYVAAGVEPANIEKTKQAVFAEIADVCENGITEEELQFARLESINSVTSIYDNPNAVAAWHFQELLEERPCTPEEYIAEIGAVTPERVRAVCRQLKLDTVYVLEAGEEQE